MLVLSTGFADGHKDIHEDECGGKMRKRKNKRKTECMVLMLLLFSLRQAFAASGGDIISNGSVDITDAIFIARYYVGMNLSSAGYQVAANAIREIIKNYVHFSENMVGV
jgi:hypothetical protein